MAGETVNAATTTEVEDNNISKQDGSVAQQEQGSQRVLGDDEVCWLHEDWPTCMPGMASQSVYRAHAGGVSMLGS